MEELVLKPMMSMIGRSLILAKGAAVMRAVLCGGNRYFDMGTGEADFLPWKRDRSSGRSALSNC